jgi:hypothetical protein
MGAAAQVAQRKKSEERQKTYPDSYLTGEAGSLERENIEKEDAIQG